MCVIPGTVQKFFSEGFFRYPPFTENRTAGTLCTNTTHKWPGHLVEPLVFRLEIGNVLYSLTREPADPATSLVFISRVVAEHIVIVMISARSDF